MKKILESTTDLLGRTFKAGDKVYINGSSKSTAFRPITVKEIYLDSDWNNRIFVDFGRARTKRFSSEVILSTPIK